MDIEVVKQLIQAFKEAELTKLDLKCEVFELKLEKEVKQVMPKSENELNNIKVDEHQVGETQKQSIQTQKSEEVEHKVIVSPMVGTFYSATSPKAQPLVKIGSKVKKGDIVCVIEAMKLMNEVEADVEGEVVEILVQNEEMVEYNEPLFVLK